ncbi:MAG: lysylphosphatidylglycerol synthase domain-containing protein [Bacteroidota bacterium]
MLLFKAAVLLLCVWFIYQRIHDASIVQFYELFFTENGWKDVLIMVLFLLFFSFLNWWCEAMKWKNMMENTIHLSPRDSLKAVLSGLAVGFVTPARAGDVVGRWLKLGTENKKPALAVFFYSSLFQTFTTLLAGVIAFILMLYFYYDPRWEWNSAYILFPVVFVIAACVAGYFVFSNFFRDKMKNKTIFGMDKISEFISWPLQEKLRFFSWSLFRYVFFCTSFVFVLWQTGVSDDWFYLFLGVSVIYLISFFLPSLIAGKLGVRELVAVLLLGGNPEADLKIIFASLIIWIFNLALPALIGAIIVSSSKITQPFARI